MMLRDVLKEYKFDCKARKLSVKTIDGYVRMNGYLFDYLEQKHGIYDVEQVRASQKLISGYGCLVHMNDQVYCWTNKLIYHIDTYHLRLPHYVESDILQKSRKKRADEATP